MAKLTMRRIYATLSKGCKIPRLEMGQSVVGFLTSFIISFLILSLVSFAMLWFGDKINKKNLAVTRYMASSQAPLIGKFYDSYGQKQITVLTYDQQFLRETGSAWPISYAQHADWILRIVEDERTRPKAIFLDVTFTQKRDDPTVNELLTGLCKAKHDYSVDIYLAALASTNDGKLHVRSDLEKGIAEGCFKLVNVNYVPDPVDRISWDYPMYSHVGSNGWSPTLPETDKPILTSAALSIAVESGGLKRPDDNNSLSLVWGVLNRQPVDNRPSLFDYCRDGDMSMYRLIPGVLRGVYSSEDSRPICPYTLTYSVSQLETLPVEQISQALKGRIVLFGAVVPGQNDLVDSPVHGTIPGVYLHAMALDNLLTYRDNYKRSKNWEFPLSKELVWSAAISIFVVLIVHVLWISVFHLLFSNRPELEEVEFDDLEVHARIAYLIPEFCGWLIRVAIQATVSMFSIVALQQCFSIGMLPVIELVGMTMLAEMFGYANKVEKFLRPPNASNS